MTANSDKRAGAGRRARGPIVGRVRLAGVMAALAAAVLVAAGCSSSSSNGPASGAASSPGASGSAAMTSAAPLGPAAKAGDVGITATTIRVGLVADVNTPVEPGLFQKSVNAVKAWATMVNNSGGLAGRKVAVDFCDSKLDPNATANCVIQACQNDFAMVGTSANALEDISDIDKCKNSAGKAAGIPDLAAVGFLPLGCDPDTYLIVGLGPYCATAKSNPQTYVAPVGDTRYYESLYKNNLHGVFVYDSDVPTLKINFLPQFQADSNSFGLKADGTGFFPEPGAAPQSALTPVVSQIRGSGSTFVYLGGTPQNSILLEREAKLQGANSVKVWACDSGCYDSSFIQQGGSIVNGTYANLNNLPFYTDYTSNPTLSKLVSALGGVSNLNNNALNAYETALLFQDAVQKAVANGGTLTRASLFTALKNEHSFNAGGIIGTTDIGNRVPSSCVAVAQVRNGQWVRAYPSKPGTFDCSSGNLATVKMNITM